MDPNESRLILKKSLFTELIRVGNLDFQPET